jgi:hypothetical protein
MRPRREEKTMAKIIYRGPSPEVNVGLFGPHRRDEIKEYPDHVAAELLATGVKQKFEQVAGAAKAMTAKDAIAAIAAAGTVEAVRALCPETEERKSVIEAAHARIAALEAADNVQGRTNAAGAGRAGAA